VWLLVPVMVPVTLDQESPGSSPGGAIKPGTDLGRAELPPTLCELVCESVSELIREYPLMWRFPYLRHCVSSCVSIICDFNHAELTCPTPRLGLRPR
jgi:hypothetical protein